MPTSIKILPHYSYKDYIHWEGRWEVIEGMPYAMSPAPMPIHQKVTNNLSAEFTFQLKKCKNCNVYQPIDYKIDEYTILQPDMLIVCREIKKKYLDFPPDLVAEILSPSTALKDRHTKFDLYQSQKIKYYLIISPETKEIEIYQWKDGIYHLKHKGAHFFYDFTFLKCKASIDFQEVW